MIEGKMLALAIISGANNISNQKQMVDELNVFPVPDGDTGTNMSMTINAGKKELELLENPTVEQTAEIAANALLRGARGNSGVILSLLFRGLSKGLKGKTRANGLDIANALTIGVEAAYGAVMKPTEGTILTVARMAADAGVSFAKTNNDEKAVFEEIIKQAKITLNETPELLPVLKKAGVVDAGGMGFLVIFEGMKQVICGKNPVEDLKQAKPSVVVNPVLNAVANFDQEIKFTYCTEYIVEKKSNSLAIAPIKLRAYLESIGDSVVCVDDETIIKIHVHTNNPGLAIQEGLKFGQLVNMKIENMKEQHNNKIVQAKHIKEDEEYVAVDPEKEYGFVAVCAGTGLQAIFADLGVDKVVSGGQTMNPSTDDILRAIQTTPAKTVFVLPNNKNIIMSAEQAVKLADRQVCVLQTRTIPQGISAMLAFEENSTYSENRLNMTKQFDLVQTGLITFAARDSDYDGHAIKQGEILCLDNGKLIFTEKDLVKALVKLTKSLAKKSDGNFITVFYGSDVTDEQAEKAHKAITEKFGEDYEISLINGGQPVYYYIISVE